jgi:hypothetical protein
MPITDQCQTLELVTIGRAEQWIAGCKGGPEIDSETGTEPGPYPWIELPWIVWIEELFEDLRP